ncbi:glycosyltransferase [Motilibacter aurantiacus]|uniref:glycosyltransferase n=1 Tax=Motilibacter aurantiacus TaxID=2714955 RepID=UPI002F2B75E2
MSDSLPFAVVVPAHDEGERVAGTVRAAAALPGVDVVVVVDDGSEDATARVAEEAGALVVRHARNRGKAAALETGAELVRALDRREGVRRHLLLLDADLGASAAGAAPLLGPVASGAADMTIGVLPAQTRDDGTSAGGLGFVVRLARDGIRQATGWEARQPLSGQRALTREAFEAGLPLASGFGVEAGLTVDLLRRGLRVREVDVELRHRATGNDWRGQLHRARQWRDVARALRERGAFPLRDTVGDVAGRARSLARR